MPDGRDGQRPRSGQTYRFGPFCLDAGRRLLLCDDRPVSITPKALETLLVLIERRGSTVSKDELLGLVWPDVAVEEASLTQNIFTLRKILGETPDQHRYIVTAPREGYRFVGEVTVVGGRPDGSIDILEDAANHAVRPVESVASPTPRPNSTRWSRASLGGTAVAVLGVALASSLIVSRTRAPMQSLAILPFVVAHTVAQNLRLQLTTDERRRLQRGVAAHAEAFDLYLRGRFHWYAGELAVSVGYFEQATEKDPAFTVAP